MSAGESSAKNLAPAVNLLDRYIFKSVLFTCTGAVALFAFIVIVPNIARDLLPYVLADQLTLVDGEKPVRFFLRRNEPTSPSSSH